MKGLGKYINDLTTELSQEVLFEPYKGRLSAKLTVNNYRLTRDNLISYNKDICEKYRGRREVIACMVIDSIRELEEIKNGTRNN